MKTERVYEQIRFIVGSAAAGELTNEWRRLVTEFQIHGMSRLEAEIEATKLCGLDGIIERSEK